MISAEMVAWQPPNVKLQRDDGLLSKTQRAGLPCHLTLITAQQSILAKSQSQWPKRAIQYDFCSKRRISASDSTSTQKWWFSKVCGFYWTSLCGYIIVFTVDFFLYKKIHIKDKVIRQACLLAFPHRQDRHSFSFVDLACCLHWPQLIVFTSWSTLGSEDPFVIRGAQSTNPLINVCLGDVAMEMLFTARRCSINGSEMILAPGLCMVKEGIHSSKNTTTAAPADATQVCPRYSTQYSVCVMLFNKAHSKKASVHRLIMKSVIFGCLHMDW